MKTFAWPMTLVLTLALGCQSTDAGGNYRGQTENLERMDRQVRGVSDSTQREQLLKTLEALRAEVEQARLQHQRDMAELQRLRAEKGRLSVNDGFSATSVSVPYFSPVAKSEGLDLWVMPVDRSGDTVKVAGTIDVTLHRRGMLGLGTTGETLAQWSLSAKEIENRWEGELYEGYHVVLPWPVSGRPRVSEALMRVTFTGTDGRARTTQKTIRLEE